MCVRDGDGWVRFMIAVFGVVLVGWFLTDCMNDHLRRDSIVRCMQHGGTAPECEVILSRSGPP